MSYCSISGLVIQLHILTNINLKTVGENKLKRLDRCRCFQWH